MGQVFRRVTVRSLQGTGGAAGRRVEAWKRGCVGREDLRSAFPTFSPPLAVASVCSVVQASTTSPACLWPAAGDVPLDRRSSAVAIL